MLMYTAVDGRIDSLLSARIEATWNNLDIPLCTSLNLVYKPQYTILYTSIVPLPYKQN